MGRGVVVANPGPVTWMRESAAAFADHGELDQYIAPTAIREADIERFRRTHLLPKKISERMVIELQKRLAAGGVGERAVRVGAGWDVANVLMMRTRLPLSVKRSLFRPQMLRFDAGVAKRLHPGVGAVIGYQGSARRTLERARELGIASVLDYPIAHPVTTERILLDEIKRVPEFAPTLLGVPYPNWLRARYDEEIATADRIIVLSNYQQRTFEENGVDPARMFIAPLCVDVDVFTPPPEPPEGPIKIAFVGQIGQRKGLSYLIDGFHRAELGPGAELLCIGMPIGPLDPWVNKPGVRYVPAMARNLLPEVLRTCHVVALPSLLEGFGATAVEGMACGLPAIVTPHTLADDVIEDGVDGWIVPIRDADAIAECLRAVDEDRDRLARMSAAARAKAEQFSWQTYRDAVRAGVLPLLDSGTR
jgi:alpha-maltose-1-phosphate synthase